VGTGQACDVSDGNDIVTPVLRTDLAEHQDRLSPATAGMFAGAAAGIMMLATVERVLRGRSDGYDLALFFGRLASNHTLVGAHAQAAGFGFALVLGSIVGVVFSKVTRHLRRFAPLLLWSIVFFPAAWTLLDAFVLPAVAPWLVPRLPFVPTLIGTLAYAVVVSLQLPLRKARIRAAT
jgi:hypothetical protein